MFAEVVINVEAPLVGTFHYHVPRDMRGSLDVGHLVEVEFGRRLAQGIVIGFDSRAPVEDTKPVIALIDERQVVWPWQIDLARWMSGYYLAPLNSCLRLMLPPGLTRWSDITVDISPRWDGRGRLTELQQQILEIVQEKGDVRGRQIGRALPKTDWKTAVNQLVRRGILRSASVLDPPRARARRVRKADLIAGPKQVRAGLLTLGRRNLQADVLQYLLDLTDPLPLEEVVLSASGATIRHLAALARAGIISRQPGRRLAVAIVRSDEAPEAYAGILAQLPMVFDGDDPVLEAESPSGPSQIPLRELEALGLVHLEVQPATISLAAADSIIYDHILRLRGAGKYQAIVQALAAAAQPVPVGELYALTGTGITHLRRLAGLDLIRLLDEEVWRDPLADRDFVPVEAPVLTADQTMVWQRVQDAMLDPDKHQRRKPFLLHGVTGSGKTEIYMHAVALALSRNQQAIVLVPEIALTPQTVRRFAARFPGRVAVLHSRLSDGERYDTWRRARQGLFDIVVGPRSALFSPLPDLGVIVVDEEHDASYKQTPPVPAPYYHARQVAIQLGRIRGATVILGSATPDVVVYHRARGGRYHLLELPKRVMGHRQRILSQAQRLRLKSRYQQHAEDPEDALTIPLPPIQVVDLRQELRAGNRSIFSRALEQALTETLDRGEQAILFLNRRGSATFVLCRDCGYVEICPRCSVPLTFHRPDLMLVCHHCGRREHQHPTCPQCDSKRIRYFGLGTEEVEARVQARWPEARITRWDRDTTAGKNTHETLLAGFINQEADILVGTQMIAKGLDLPLVTLVGVISADVSLGMPDYRTGERAFQILAQVAGRAGRGLLGGRVVIQTYRPDHYAIRAAAEHDYASFYVEEIRFRTRHGLPPFRRQARLAYADPVNEKGRREAEYLARGLRVHIREKALGATEVFGPVPPFFNRIDGRYRWQIIVRSPDPAGLLADFPIARNWQVDIDPMTTL